MRVSGPLPLRAIAIGAAIAASAAAAVVLIAVMTQSVREAVTTYTRLIAAANRQDLDAARALCSSHYLKTHVLAPAREGGIVGLPRGIHPNFQAWKKGPNVLLCPTNRVGPIYQFVNERGSWRFDGPVGLLRGRWQIVPLDKLSDGAKPAPSTH